MNDKVTAHEALLKKLADRTALIMMSYWAKHDTFAPFDDPDFWHSLSANELRSMPQYQESIAVIREMLK